MTRINVVVPAELHDQHLMAEYRELPHIMASLRRSLKSASFNISKIPSKYTLNKGHVMFFYNKLKWLEKRYTLLCKELIDRGFNIAPENRKVNFKGFPAWCYHDYVPNEEDKKINRERIYTRLLEKPGWYRKTPYVSERESEKDN